MRSCTEVVVYDGKPYQLQGHVGDHITRVWAATGKFYEHDMLHAIAQRKLNGAYVDVGAHVGNHAVFFSQVCPATSVVALEASLRNFELLRLNTAYCGDITVLPVIAGSGAERAVQTPATDENTGMDKCTVVDVGADLTVALDRLVYKHPIVVLKIDVEGFEIPVLQGARRVLEAHRPRILVIEAATDEAFAQHRAFLNDFDYKPTMCFNATPTYFWEPKV